MTTKRVFHVAELRGGPRDGERIVMDGVPNEFVPLTLPALGEVDPVDLSQMPAFLIGEYVYDRGPTQIAEVSEGKLLDDAPYVFAHARKHMRPTGYVWQGWRDA